MVLTWSSSIRSGATDVVLYWQQWRLHSPALDRVADAVRDAARAHLDQGSGAERLRAGDPLASRPRRSATADPLRAPRAWPAGTP